MRYMKWLATSFCLAATMFAAAESQAASCTYINTGDQGDNDHLWGSWGWQCQQSFINYWWDSFDFDSGDWDEGFGYEAPCDNARPLARTFNGLYALGYSTFNNPDCNTGVANITQWAMCWSAANIDELDGRCGNGGTSGTAATTHRGVDDYTELYWPFFYGMDVVQRAASVFHEARHANGCGHNAGTSCPRGGSCDNKWNQGCGTSTSQGANQFEVNYLSWYANSAWRTTPTLRTSAVSRANDILATGFRVDPCIRMSANGGTFKTC